MNQFRKSNQLYRINWISGAMYEISIHLKGEKQGEEGVTGNTLGVRGS